MEVSTLRVDIFQAVKSQSRYQFNCGLCCCCCCCWHFISNDVFKPLRHSHGITSIAVFDVVVVVHNSQHFVSNDLFKPLRHSHGITSIAVFVVFVVVVHNG